MRVAPPHQRQLFLIAIVVVCSVIIAWWAIDMKGGLTGARYQLSKMSWAAGAQGTGALTLTVDRPPTESMLGATVRSASVTGLQPTVALTPDELANAAALLPNFRGAKITGISITGRSVTLGKSVTPPAGWPTKTWTADVMSGELTLV